MVGGTGYQKRTFFQGITDRLPGTDTVSLCGNGFCQYHAVALGSIAADDRRDGTKVSLFPVFQFFEGAPA